MDTISEILFVLERALAGPWLQPRQQASEPSVLVAKNVSYQAAKWADEGRLRVNLFRSASESGRLERVEIGIYFVFGTKRQISTLERFLI
ncbi:hypothetical protein [Mesorhizobium sp.]|uniref:hypothetical protein n=1 Tax=Mesorhizobium sp. TaxID=1871066 RepID=UPI000FEA3B27|nr:hypothetical protein [Mesorhizobium sp.]RWO52479.1 MAG: hypothetical protein EOS13_14965 [Mesorhizobium sp.]TIN23930.1 MAG: hypothetical protein E5Y19_24460 [Mesorhizobium sp.]TIN35328.1 MAG: hypothetical protein E5Y13_27220 [Mesorhizobium sp.]TJU78963.1 MAG: hypothetical protein E5Y15_24470 [Mesorhizobium sp.]TJU85071.1 MAG: hypothetical protein E5Y10_26975 [Mesorhizobium sp.]